ncbi:P-loop NTPase [Candidatus Nitrospira nitrificans]|uniref:Putative Septum site-determining protein MinD n=1 Tax=Candidatus Nitrospira nitrificans TaxID=1742973 RepID=A0A0S4LKT3_9BACT|nr:P-loop NTPase [Candidatus Nitrospira nitrificans]CUS36550.1 putative Septum site-determining protein MinD [Candidatus Nitrospira nitrificans]
MATLISVASGKGGVGKSVVSANLALALAKRGRQVILADLDVGGADAHIMFGELNPAVTLTDFLNKRVNRLNEAAIPITMHPNLRLIAGTGETLATANMAYARKKRLMKQFRELESDVVVIDIGAGTNFHALDFFLMADIHLAVATPEPTSVLDLYRFIKLAAIRRVLACFLARSPMSEVLSNRDFTSVEEVMDVAGATDTEGRDVAVAALRSFRPGLIINRISDSSRVNVLYLRKILHQYVGGDLTLIGEIPDDPAVSQAVRKFLPVIEAAPESLAAKGLSAVSAAVEQFIDTLTDKSKGETRQSDEKQTRVLLSNPVFSHDSQTALPLKSEVPPPSIEPRQPAGASTIQNTNGLVA